MKSHLLILGLTLGLGSAGADRVDPHRILTITTNVPMSEMNLGKALETLVHPVARPTPGDQVDWSLPPGGVPAINLPPGATLSNGVLHVTTSNVVAESDDWPRLRFRLESFNPNALPDFSKGVASPSDDAVYHWESYLSDYGGRIVVHGLIPQKVMPKTNSVSWFKELVEQHFVRTGEFPPGVIVLYAQPGMIAASDFRHGRLHPKIVREPGTSKVDHLPLLLPVKPYPDGAPVDGSRVKVSVNRLEPCKCHGEPHPVSVIQTFVRKHGHWMEVLP